MNFKRKEDRVLSSIRCVRGGGELAGKNEGDEEGRKKRKQNRQEKKDANFDNDD